MERFDDPMDLPADAIPRWRERIIELHRLELRAVRRQVRLGRSALLKPFALSLNHLGNGWLYPLLALALLWRYPEGFVTIALSAALAAGIAHLIYPWIKRRVARPGPATSILICRPYCAHWTATPFRVVTA